MISILYYWLSFLTSDPKVSVVTESRFNVFGLYGLTFYGPAGGANECMHLQHLLGLSKLLIKVILVKYYNFKVRWRNWIAHLSTEQEVGRSSRPWIDIFSPF